METCIILWRTVGEAIHKLKKAFAWCPNVASVSQQTWRRALDRFYGTHNLFDSTGKLPHADSDLMANITDVLSRHPGESVETRLSVGRLLQLLGTELGRDVFGEDLWVQELARRWRARGEPPLIVTDVRFPNEFEFLKTMLDARMILIDADKRLALPTHELKGDGRPTSF